MRRLYYFAYGRNMLERAITFRVGLAKKIGPYRFNGYKLVFNVGWHVAYGNMMKGNDDDFIEGVLYELSDRQVYELDRYENYPINYQKRYFTHEDGNIIFAYMTVDKKAFTDELASREYIVDLYHGAKENGLEHTRLMMKDYLDNTLKEPLRTKKKKDAHDPSNWEGLNARLARRYNML